MPPSKGRRYGRKPDSFCIPASDTPGVSLTQKIVDLVDFCPDKPSEHLKWGADKVGC